MYLDPKQLPTPIAQVARRANTVGLEASADSFMTLSYLFEVALKSCAIVLHAALRRSNPDHAYSVGYELVRADGLGVWEQAIRTATSVPVASFFSPDLRPALQFFTQRRGRPDDDWFREATAAIERVCSLLEIESGVPEAKPNVLHLTSALVQIRNKTKAHGAAGPDFFAAAVEPYGVALRLFVTQCPIFSWSWIYLYYRGPSQKKGVQLSGGDPYALPDAQVADLEILEPGVHFWPPTAPRPTSCAHLLFADRECKAFFYPNGGYNSNQPDAEFIDYATGQCQRYGVPHFGRPPAPLPRSETHGLEALDIQSNAFGNLPPFPSGYVQRVALQEELETRLRDTNHPIITLHGRGGIGKTSLALWVSHKLAAEQPCPFEAIVWFSARDVDLRPSGPRAVRPAVVSLDDIARLYGELLGTGTTVANFAGVLQTPAPSGFGTLFVFDNFETLADVVDLHRFLDTHTHIPNKVLITSRERAFKADFPIEVHGMSRSEATQLITSVAADMRIEGFFTNDVINRLFEYSEGHPYVLRILIGEIAKERRFVPPKALIPRRLDLVNVVFERSFNRLTDAGKRVFLTVANWRSAVSELALIVVLGRHGMDIEAGVEECLRLSLLTPVYFTDNQRAFAAPQLARVFAGKKLEGDPDRLLIQEDLEILRRFGVLPVGQPIQVPEASALLQFMNWCVDQSSGDAAEADRLDTILQTLAELWPPAWKGLASFRRRRMVDPADVAYALRRAVEENPTDKDAVLERAQHARNVGDEATWISSLVRAVELDPTDVGLLYQAANDLNNYVFRHAAEIPTRRRGVYLASVRARMTALADQLDATGLSRLAWLYLHEDNSVMAAEFTKRGLTLEPDNIHCLRLAERLRESGAAM